MREKCDYVPTTCRVLTTVNSCKDEFGHRSIPFIGRGETGAGQNVPVHCPFEFRNPGSMVKAKMRNVQREQLEPVTMDAMATGRTRPTVILNPEIVARLPERCVAGVPRPFLKPPQPGVDVVCAPVPEDTARRIGIVNDQCKAAGSPRRIGPFQSRRPVCPLAGELPGYGLAGGGRPRH